MKNIYAFFTITCLAIFYSTLSKAEETSLLFAQKSLTPAAALKGKLQTLAADKTAASAILGVTIESAATPRPKPYRPLCLAVTPRLGGGRDACATAGYPTPFSQFGRCIGLPIMVRGSALPTPLATAALSLSLSLSVRSESDGDSRPWCMRRIPP